jgi:hypothetical protein
MGTRPERALAQLRTVVHVHGRGNGTAGDERVVTRQQA